MDDHKFQIYLGEKDKGALTKVFPVPVEDAENQVKGGSVGLTTMETKAGFDNILLEPDLTLDLVPDHQPQKDGTYAEDTDESSFL